MSCPRRARVSASVISDPCLQAEPVSKELAAFFAKPAQSHSLCCSSPALCTLVQGPFLLRAMHTNENPVQLTPLPSKPSASRKLFRRAWLSVYTCWQLATSANSSPLGVHVLSPLFAASLPLHLSL